MNEITMKKRRKKRKATIKIVYRDFFQNGRLRHSTGNDTFN